MNVEEIKRGKMSGGAFGGANLFLVSFLYFSLCGFVDLSICSSSSNHNDSYFVVCCLLLLALVNLLLYLIVAHFTQLFDCVSIKYR